MQVLVAGRGHVAVRGAHIMALTAQLMSIDADIACLPSIEDEGSLEGPGLRSEAAANGWRCVPDVASAHLGPADLLLSLQYGRIIGIADLGGARALNLHFGLVPRHRGSLSCYWPVLGRDDTVAVTLHELTDKVDAGPVVAQREFPLPGHTSAAELSHLFHRNGGELLAELAQSVLTGDYTVRAQADADGPAHRRIDLSDREITDFDRPAAVVRAACLALVFPRFQLPTFQGREIDDAFVLAAPPAGASRCPGDVVASSERVVAVQCRDAVVCFSVAGGPRRPSGTARSRT